LSEGDQTGMPTFRSRGSQGGEGREKVSAEIILRGLYTQGGKEKKENKLEGNVGRKAGSNEKARGEKFSKH